jgi:hypothetical protein
MNEKSTCKPELVINRADFRLFIFCFFSRGFSFGLGRGFCLFQKDFILRDRTVLQGSQSLEGCHA